MHLASNIWYVRWFFWSCRVQDRFWRSRRLWDDNENKYREKGTNLCQFFRTLLFGVVLSALTFAIYGSLLFSIFVLPLLLFPIFSISKLILIIVGIVTAVALGVAAIIGAGWLGSRTFAYLHGRAMRSDKSPGFTSLFIHYLIALKQRFCPMIVFDKDQSDA